MSVLSNKSSAEAERKDIDRLLERVDDATIDDAIKSQDLELPISYTHDVEPLEPSIMQDD